jgi:ubiquinone biosynthesis protein COQ4
MDHFPSEKESSMNDLRESSSDPRQFAIIMKKFGHLVEAPYGDFRGIADMAQEIMTPQTTAMVSRTVLNDPTGAAALSVRPRLGEVDLAALATSPEGTLGWRYGHHMIDNGYHAPPMLPVTDAASYFIAHLVEVHDIWHVMSGWNTDKVGEIGLQGFCAAQLHPSQAFLALLAKNLLKTALEDLDRADDHLRALVAGWLQGKRVRPLFGVAWKPLFPEKLADVRAHFGFSEEPEIPFLRYR